MSPELKLAVLLFLVGLCAAMFLAALFRALRGELMRRFLLGVGRRAVSRQPDRIKLLPLARHDWINPAAVAALTEPLRGLGFVDCGIFAIDRLPDFRMIILINTQTGTGAYVKEHPKVGAWIELGVRYADDSVVAVVTSPQTSITPPPFYRRIQGDPAESVERLYQLLLRERPAAGIKPLTADNFAAEYEEGYVRTIAWQKKRGMSLEEVQGTARRWAQKRRGDGAKGA